MKESTAYTLLEKVKVDYDVIAKDFSKTRRELWSDLLFLGNIAKDNDNILDLGCGNGRLVKLFEDLRINYTGIDISPNLISEAMQDFGENDRQKFVVGDALNLPFADNSFDKVYSIAFFHHIPSKKMRIQVMNELKRVLKPEGILLLTVWNLRQKKFRKFIYQNIFNKLKGKSEMDFFDALIPWRRDGEPILRYCHAFTKNELKKLVVNADFKLMEIDYSIRKNDKANLYVIAQAKK